jgi:hypothetical protein
MPTAIGTALMVIAMNSFAGFAGHLGSVHIEWAVAAAVTAAALAGGLVGARLTAVVSPDGVRKAFGWFILAMSSVIIAQEVHPAAGIAAAVLTMLAAAITFACSRYARCPLRRLNGRQAVAVAAT